jgi:hypothetical protein
MQLLQSIFIGWIILLSRVNADYSDEEKRASALGDTAGGTSGTVINASHRRLRSRGKVNSMKPLTIIGILLIFLGIVGYATGGLSFTHEKKVADLGGVEISRKTQDTLPLSPILSTVSLVAGLGLVVIGSKAK